MKHRPSCHRLRPPVRAAGFTLVEMLAVIGIVLILTTATIFSIQKSSGATSRRAAVRNLMGVFDQARMVAISDGRPTYVVFASVPKGQKDLSADALSDMWGRAYALFEDPPVTDASTTSSFYPLQRSAWLYLPTGVAFKCDNGGDTTHVSVTATPRDQISPSSDPDKTVFKIQSRTGGASTDMTLPYVKFDATGQIVDHNGNIVDATSPFVRVLVFEGIANGSGAETSTHQIASTNGSKYALDEILLKPTTGRAEYTLDPSNNLAAATSATSTP